MPPKPITRSASFWCGLIVAGIICFGWFSSYFYDSWLGWDCVSASNTNGGIEVNAAYSRQGFYGGGEWKIHFNDHLKDSMIMMPFVLRGARYEHPTGKGPVAGTYRGNQEAMMARRDPEAWLFYVPHWLILLMVGIPWAGLLLWRERRIRREAAEVMRALEAEAGKTDVLMTQH